MSPEGVSPEGRVPGAWTRSQSAGSGGGALAGFVLFSSSQCHSRPNPLIFIGRESESPTINSSHQSSPVCKTVLAGFAGAIPSLILNFGGGHSGLNPSQPIPRAHWFPATGPEAALQPPSDSSMAWRPLGVKEPGVCFKRCVKTQRHRNECHEQVYTKVPRNRSQRTPRRATGGGSRGWVSLWLPREARGMFESRGLASSGRAGPRAPGAAPVVWPRPGR